MLEPFDFILDLLFFRWLLGTDDEGSSVRTAILVLIFLLIVLFVVGACLGWWW